MREEFPYDTATYLLLGIALIRDEKYDKSKRVVQNALNKFSNDW
ncbi:MAG: hypothetical protein QY331_10885 [Melioribacteraceae bacterium]|nr:MAG: hypothetical protein QY331_10885 [Melioribacteraceae bacterium]